MRLFPIIIILIFEVYVNVVRSYQGVILRSDKQGLWQHKLARLNELQGIQLLNVIFRLVFDRLTNKAQKHLDNYVRDFYIFTKITVLLSLFGGHLVNVYERTVRNYRGDVAADGSDAQSCHCPLN